MVLQQVEEQRHLEVKFKISSTLATAHGMLEVGGLGVCCLIGCYCWDKLKKTNPHRDGWQKEKGKEKEGDRNCRQKGSSREHWQRLLRTTNQNSGRVTAPLSTFRFRKKRLPPKTLTHQPKGVGGFIRKLEVPAKTT